MSHQENEVIVITGVSRGIGKAMAKGFAERGYVVARDEEAVSGLNSELGKPHRFSVVDVSSGEQVSRWAQETLEELKPPGYVINNAAIINQPEPVWRISEQAFNELLQVNVLGMHNVVRAFLPAMLEAKRGIIVNMSSGAGRTGLPDVAPYCTTKWAVEGYSASLAQELPETLACVPLSPGIVSTDMLLKYFGESARSYPDAEAWAKRGVPHILSIKPEHNGEPLRTPQV